jgi:hypothetical protein
MLHEARLELRQLKSKSSFGENGEGTEGEQKVMESTIKKFEQKYKQQMREQTERIKAQTEEKI